MRIYIAWGNAVYTVDADKFDVDVNLAAGTYDTVVQAWDNCGGVGKTDVNITVKGTTLPPAKFVYSTQYGNGTVMGYIVQTATGQLYNNGQGPVWAHWGPTRIVSDSTGTHLYAANQGSHDVSAYTINRDNGYLTPAPGANFPDAGWSTDIAVHPSGKFVYVTTSDNDESLPQTANSVTAFSVGSDGSLTQVPGSPYQTGGEEFALAVDPNGKYLYATGIASDQIYSSVIDAYSIDQTTGALTPVPGSPFPVVPVKCQYCLSEEIFLDLAVDPSGKFLIGPGWINGVIYVYAIDSSTGSLTNAPGSPFIEGEPCGAGCPSAGPWSVTVSGNGKFAFVENELSPAVVTYQLNASTGGLTLLTTTYGPYFSFGLGEDSVRADPSGSLVYALGYVNATQPKGGLIGWVIDQSSGMLTVVPNAPYPDDLDLNTLSDGIAVTP